MPKRLRPVYGVASDGGDLSKGFSDGPTQDLSSLLQLSPDGPSPVIVRLDVEPQKVLYCWEPSTSTWRKV